MKKLVTISREYGSGGRIIGELLAEKLKVPFYDKEIIDMAVEQSGYSREVIEGAELKAKSSFAYSLASALSFNEGTTGSVLSVNDRLFLAQFQVIREIGDTGSGVIVGRCADYVLREMPGVTNVFIYAEYEDRLKRAVEKYGDDPEKAEDIISTYDKARQNYYNYHTGMKWGEYKNYNLAINSSYISEEEAANLIVSYIENRRYL
ncbi:MAG: cytidylate kinase-like family protein [Firmicutes bacterium]|nr:cytidylate kinase-like family protein [Bacillota bacterium]